jgi:uncharacterized protein (TIGR00255 family)
MKSMTGYGRGTCEVAGRRLVIELRSLNHRFLEVKLRLPWPDPGLEQLMTQLCRSRLDRGMLTLSVRDEGGGSAQEVRADLDLARAYAAALAQIGEALSLPPPSLDLIATQPGVLRAGEALADPDALWATLKPALEQALAALIDSRRREGAALAADLGARTDKLEALAAELQALTRDAPENHRRRLRERLDRVLSPSDGVDPQRLAQEVAILAERVDVAEELTRLSTHLAELRRLLAHDGGPSGRRLDFLTQELNREINTVGSKCQSAQVAARVVDAKAELERLREQIQNVE